MSEENWGIFLNGSYGVGKSTVLDHIGDTLHRLGVPFCLMDVDWFHRSWPPAHFDPDNTLIEARNMQAVWANYRTAGPRQLVISGVLRTEADRARYGEALDLRIRSVRLTATPETTEPRLAARYSSSQAEAHRWHVERYARLADSLAEADLDEAVIPTDETPPAAVASAVLAHFGFGAA